MIVNDKINKITRPSEYQKGYLLGVGDTFYKKRLSSTKLISYIL